MSTPSNRWRIILVAFVSLTLLFCGMYSLYPQTPKWRRYLDTHYGQYDVDPSRHYPGIDSPWKERVAALQQMKYEPTWTNETLDHLMKIVREGYPKSNREKLSENERGAYSVWAEAQMAILARMESEAPVPASTRDIMQAYWLEMLSHDFPEQRSSAALYLIHQKFIEDPTVRKRVEKLLGDPDEHNREVVKLQLDRYDHQKARRLAQKKK